MNRRIGLAGDVMLGRLVDERQRRRSVTAVWGDLLERLRSLDGLFVNLECALSTRGEPWRRTRRAFHFRADPDWAVPALDEAGVDCCALANNHVLDFEEVALHDTLDALHWGPNMVETPPERFRSFAHWLVDRSVDVVHGHSAHVFQGIEVSRGRPILYDTGDFVDDYAVDDRLRNDRGFLFDLSVSPAGDSVELRLHPTMIDDCAVHGAGPEAAAWSRERMAQLSDPFGTSFDRDGTALVTVLDG